jgi:uncharacterized protein (DUF924 family)
MKDTREDILSFWFTETTPAQWFQVSPIFDEMVRMKFLDHFLLADRGYVDDWANSADGALALILTFDQFPRNMFRDTPKQYETDAKALKVAELAIERGFDQVMTPLKRKFFYLPFEHSEDLDHQYRSVELFEKMKNDDPMAVEYAERHLRVIEQFGRFPHRNKILGRESTPAEETFLATVGKY